MTLERSRPLPPEVAIPSVGGRQDDRLGWLSVVVRGPLEEEELTATLDRVAQLGAAGAEIVLLEAAEDGRSRRLLAWARHIVPGLVIAPRRGEAGELDLLLPVVSRASVWVVDAGTSWDEGIVRRLDRCRRRGDLGDGRLGTVLRYREGRFEPEPGPRPAFAHRAAERVLRVVGRPAGRRSGAGVGLPRA